MNPTRVYARNYRSFGELDLDLPAGCLAILGDNGAGKSSIINVVDLALFGARSLGDYLTDGVADTELEVGLEFEHADELYRVRRSYSARGRGQAKLDLERLEQGPHDYAPDWRPLTCETAAATQQLIEKTLGLSRDTFRASSFLAQGDGAAFTEAQPRERKAILAEILGLDVWDRLLDRCRTDLRDVERTLAISESRLTALADETARRPQLEDDLADAERAEHAARNTVGEAERALADAQQRRHALDATLERVAALRERRDNREAALTATAEAVSEAKMAASRVEATERDLAATAGIAAQIPVLERQLAEIREQQAAADAARREKQAVVDQYGVVTRELQGILRRSQEIAARGDELRVRRDLLASEHDATCDRCGQELRADARARASESLTDEIETLIGEMDTLRARSDELEQELERLRVRSDGITVPDPPVQHPDVVERQLAHARQAAERRSALEATLLRDRDAAARVPALEQDLAARRAELAAATRDLDEEAACVPDVHGLDRVVAHHRAALADAQRHLHDTVGRVARVREQLAAVARSEAEIGRLRTGRDADQRRLDLLKVAERAYGRDGVPALIVENAAIPQIETEANRILDELGTPFRVELRTQRALKTGDGVRDTLDIVITSPAGERPYETFSGGERTRLNLALRIGLARLLAHRRGAESRLLAIDEPEFLDEPGVVRLAEVLRGLAGDFERVILISHVPTLAASFDQTLTVVKDGDRSRVDAGVPTGVAA